MKNFTLLAVAFLVFFSVKGQNIEWTKSFGSVNYDYMSCVVTDDFNNVWFFYSPGDTVNLTTQYFLKKFDQPGNLLSTDTFPIAIKIYYVQRTDHSTFYIVGFSSDTALQLNGHRVGYGSFFGEMDYNNNWLNAHIFWPPGWEDNAGNDFKFDDAENLYVAATEHDHFLGAVLSHIFKFNSQGNIIYNYSGGPHANGIAVQPISNGNSYSFFVINGHQSTTTYFNELDSFGNLLWSIHSPLIRKMTVDTSGNLYIMGNFSGTMQIGTFILNGSVNYNNIFLAKMDSLHNFLWAISINGIGALEGELLNCDPVNQRLYLAGYYTDSLIYNGIIYGSDYYSVSHSSLFLASFDLNSNNPWITIVPCSHSVTPGSMADNQNGHVYISGNFVDTLFVNPPLVSVTEWRPDIFLMEIADQTNSIDNVFKNIPISIYPNPADKFITINLPDAKYSNVQLFNSTGAIVKLFSNQENKFQIHVEDLSDGIYFIRAISEDNNPVSTRIIVTHKK